MSALSRSSLYWDEARWGASVAVARQQAHARHIIPMTTDKPDLVWSSECKPRRAVTGQTLPLPVFCSGFGSFSETIIYME